MSYSLFVHPLARLDILDAWSGTRISDRASGWRWPIRLDAAIGDGGRLVVLAVSHVRRDSMAWRSRAAPSAAAPIDAQEE